MNDVSRYLQMTSEQLTPLADGGDAEAQYQLGLRLYLGRVMPKDVRAAFTLWGKAAQSGHALAQNNLGIIHLSGEAGKRNEKMAYFWFNKAAAQGNDLGQVNLGKMYFNGTGVGQNYDTAREWFEKSAAQGNREAEQLLAQTPREVPAKKTWGVLLIVLAILPWSYYYMTHLAARVNSAIGLGQGGRVSIAVYVLPILLPPVLLLWLLFRGDGNPD